MDDQEERIVRVEIDHFAAMESMIPLIADGQDYMGFGRPCAEVVLHGMTVALSAITEIPVEIDELLGWQRGDQRSKGDQRINRCLIGGKTRLASGRECIRPDGEADRAAYGRPIEID